MSVLSKTLAAALLLGGSAMEERSTLVLNS
jgi:hypothetical protein